MNPSKKIFILFCFLCTTSLTINAQIHEELMREGASFEEIVRKSNAHFDKVGRIKGVGYKQFQRWQYWAQRNLDANGRVILPKDASKAYRKFNSQNKNQRNVTGDFEEMGPKSAINTSTWSSHLGRVSALGLDPNDDSHILIGSPTGGIWKTNTTGEAWAPIFDDQALIDVWSLEISHANSNHYWAGLASGMVRSMDGGVTWTAVTGLDDDDLYNTLVMHPTNENILFTVGQFEGNIYKSTDGGASFNLVYTTGGANLYDLEIKPGSPNTIYASGSGTIVRSTNTGDSFSSLSGPWNGSGVIMMDVTPDDAEYIYALQESGGGLYGIYRSVNSGTNWTTQLDNTCNCNNYLGYNTNSGAGQAPRDMDIVVSPIDKNEIHVAGTETYRSLNAGGTWVKTTSWYLPDPEPFIHADIDLLVYHGDRLYAGTDGGLFYSTDEANSFEDISQGLGIRQFYRIGASETDIDRVSGGSQDNGTGVVKDGIWYDFIGADGMETFIDWNNEDIIYGTIQNGPIYKSTDGGNTVSSTPQAPGSGNWVTPLEQDPTNPNTLYTGKGEVYKSTNGANSWTAISSFSSGNISELKIAASDNQVMYAAIGSTLQKTTNGGVSWTNVSPGGFINYISIHPTDPNRVAVALSGLGVRVRETTNGGTNWNDISSNLPDEITIECVLYENDGNLGMFLGGNPGIWHKDNSSGGDWASVSANLPEVRVTELETRNQILYVGTYGRGLWKASLDLVDYALGSPESTQEICSPDDAVFDINVISYQGFSDPVTLSFTASGGSLTGSFTTNPVIPGNSTTFTITNTASLAAGTYPITVTGTTAAGGSKDLSLTLIVQDDIPAVASLVTPADGATDVSVTSSFSWNGSTEADEYLVELASDAGFTNIIQSEITVLTSGFTFTAGLDINTTYYWRVTASNLCGDAAPSTVFSFDTQDLSYCTSTSENATEEWIESVEIAGISNTTGSDGGYGDFSNIIIDMDIGQSYPFTLTPAYSGTVYGEYFIIWIDYNNNGSFEDAGELVYDAGATSTSAVSGNITIPNSVTPGNVRMRISMKYNAAPASCEIFTYGEVEDYTVNLVDQSPCPADVMESGSYASGTNLVIESTTYIQSDAIVELGANVTYDATSYIELNGGFTIEVGAEFLAIIDGCGGSVSLKDEEEDRQE